MQTTRLFFQHCTKKMICNIISPLSVDHFTSYTFSMAMSESSFALTLLSVIVTGRLAVFLGLFNFLFLFNFSYSQGHLIFHHQQHGISTHFFFSSQEHKWISLVPTVNFGEVYTHSELSIIDILDIYTYL